MMALVSQLDKAQFSPRFYIVADTDRMGRDKALAAERRWDTVRVGGSQHG